MAEKFLILGASSFYGRSFADLVASRGDTAICLSKPQFDLDETWWLDAAVVDDCYVVNFISKSLVAESWENPMAWVLTNGVNTTALINRLKDRPIKRFVHVSTPEVYGSNTAWVKEWKEFRPTTPYAVSRAAGDMMLKAYHKAYNFPAIITRTANIYGVGQQSYRIIPKAFEFKKRGAVLPLHGSGSSKRSFIHIRDACNATYKICKEGKIGETYHISTLKAHTIRQVVEMIGCKWEDAPDRLGKDYAYLLDSTKVRDLGWTDRITLEEGLEEYANHAANG